jgi:hypothetical protein
MEWTEILNIILVGLVAAIPLFLLYPIISNYRLEMKHRRKYWLYGKYYK